MVRVLAVLAILAVGRCAAGQSNVADPAPRFEVWGGLSAMVSGPSGDLTSSYSPPLLLDGTFTSHGGQTLTFDSESAVGFEAGTNVFLSPHAGVQFVFDRHAPALAGVNSPSDLALQYTSRLPPDNIPRLVEIQRSTPWPDTNGSMTQTAVSVNGVVRTGLRGRVGLTASGGLAFSRLSGTVQPLGFTAYHLGGHSVLFEDDALLAVSLEPTAAIGYNAGGDINIGIHEGLAVMVGYRYRGGPTVDVPVRVTTVLNADQIAFQQTIGDITERLALAPARVSTSSSRIVIGLKFTH